MTYFRSSATLIYFARDLNIDLFVLYPERRQGKEYDTIKAQQLAEVAPHVMGVPFQDESDIPRLLKQHNLSRVLTQDASHHFPELCLDPRFHVYSLSVFIDSLHHAWRVKTGEAKKVIPHRVYFPCTYIEQKFFSIGSYQPAELSHKTFGSPLFDHLLFLESPMITEGKKIIYITPPPNLLRFFMFRNVGRLFRHIKERGYYLIVKDRVKTPLPTQLAPFCDEHHTTEKILPYASIELINQSMLHICGYSTSIFEARLLNKPTLNLDINLSRSVMGNFVSNYLIEDLYNSQTCLTKRTGFEAAFDSLVSSTADAYQENVRFIAPLLERSMTENASIRILNDILHDSD